MLEHREARDHKGTLAHRVRRGLRVLLVLRVHKVPLAHRDRRVLLEHKGVKVPQDHRVLRVMSEHRAHRAHRVRREQMLYGILLGRTILAPPMPLAMLLHMTARLGIASMRMAAILATRP